jgi:putative transposase
MTCRILQLSRSSYYRRLRNVSQTYKVLSQSSEETHVKETITHIASEHPFWGYRRITAYMRKKCGFTINRKRVRRIMRLHGLSVPQKRYKAKRAETRSKPRPTGVNEWWGTDMTKFYVHHTGWVYLVVVIDWYTKRVLGYALGLRPKTELWLAALRDAVETACPEGSRSYGICLMSDNGSQPTSQRYEKELETLGINHITTSYNNPRGNADTERFLRTFKEEVVWPNEFEYLDDVISAAKTFFRFYNEDYPHSAIGEQSPLEFERALNQMIDAA